MNKERLVKRVAALEHGGDGADIGAVQALLEREEFGEVIDWQAVKVSPALVRALEAL